MTLSMTKHVHIDRPAADTFAFVGDPSTMPRWAVHNVSAIRPLGDGRWEMDTPRGRGLLVPRYDTSTGILDHDFIDANEGHWRVPARVVPAGASASIYIITLTKPEGMPTEAFEEGMKLMDDELAALKACVEGRA